MCHACILHAMYVHVELTCMLNDVHVNVTCVFRCYSNVEVCIHVLVVVCMHV